MIKLFIENRTSNHFKYTRLSRKIAKKIIQKEKIDGLCEINLLIVSNQEMTKIMSQYKNQNHPTDVLSFPNNYQELKPIIGYNMLGDIFISQEKVNEQAKCYQHSQKREWAYLFAHGLLHLIGYDHQNQKAEQQMHFKIEQTLSELGVNRHAKIY